MLKTLLYPKKMIKEDLYFLLVDPDINQDENKVYFFLFPSTFSPDDLHGHDHHDHDPHNG